MEGEMKVSGPSMESYQSLSYSLSSTSSFASSPTSDVGPAFPQTSSELLQSSFPAAAPPTPSTSTQEFEDKLPSFDIEKDDDPSIRPELYYDFKVGKKESYFELKPGYRVTPNFPQRKSVEVTKFKTGRNTGKNQYSCRVPSCTASPFTRHYDLDRHFRSIHLDNASTYFDYKNCPHKDAFRRDFCRENYREYHLEDLIKRNGARIEDKSYLTGCGNCQNMWIPHETDPTQWVECPTCQGPELGPFM